MLGRLVTQRLCRLPGLISNRKRFVRPLRSSYMSPQLFFYRQVTSAVNMTFSVMVFDKHGDFVEKEFTKHGLLRDTGLNARDLIVLDSGFHRRPRPCILVRDTAFIVCMAYIRAIVQAQNVFLFHPSDMDVKYFSTRFSAYLKGKRPPFLPTVFLGESPESRIVDEPDQIAQQTKQLPFECKALEGILSQVCRQYYNRTLLLSPLVKNLLQELSSRKVDPATLHKLLPMKDVLSQFEIETTLMRNTLDEILSNDDDMLKMLLTERSKLEGELPIEKHELVELLLENYCSQMVDISQEAYYLRKQIESTQSIIELKLDTYRNHMLRINMQLAISSIVLASSTAVAGIFGMNLTSGIEAHPYAFYWILIGSCVGMMGLFSQLNRAVNRSLPSALDDTTYKESIFNHLGDIQYILGYASASKEKSGITRKNFADLLKSLSGVHIDDDELDVIFKTFDLDKDGTLSPAERQHRKNLRDIRSEIRANSFAR